MLSKEAIIEQLKYAIQALSLDAEGQLASFPEFVVVTDELLLEFANWKSAAVGNYPDYFSDEQLKILDDIDVLTDKYEPENLTMSIAEELNPHHFGRC